MRNTGNDYCVTRHPEEYDARYPERAIRFPSSWETQQFVSAWYQRENHPLAR